MNDEPIGTCVALGRIMPVVNIAIRVGQIEFIVELPNDLEGDFSQEEFRIHGSDGSLICLIPQFPSFAKLGPMPTDARRLLVLPLVIVDNRAEA